MDVAKHGEFWRKVANESADRIGTMFSESGMTLKSAIGKETIEDYGDAKKVMAFVMSHADTSEETANCMLSVCEWLHACNEICLAK